MSMLVTRTAVTSSDLEIACLDPLAANSTVVSATALAGWPLYFTLLSAAADRTHGLGLALAAAGAS